MDVIIEKTVIGQLFSLCLALAEKEEGMGLYRRNYLKAYLVEFNIQWIKDEEHNRGYVLSVSCQVYFS